MSEPRTNAAADAAPRVGALFWSGPVVRVYDFLTNHPLWAEQNASLVRHFGDDAPAHPRVLDLGAGTGVGTRAIAAALHGRAEIIGVDFSSKMVDLANARQIESGGEGVSFQQADATRMDHFEDASMDFVVANSFLYLVPRAAAVLSEVHRVLKPGGRAVFMEPREEGSYLRAAIGSLRQLRQVLRAPAASVRLALGLTSWRVLSGVEGRMSGSELRALFAQAGFPEISLEPTLGGLGQHVIATRC